MKKILLITFLAGVIHLSFHQGVFAQEYKTGFGLFVDLGNGTSFVGPHIKHFFSENNAGQATLTFGGDVTALSAEYSYNKSIPNANGLFWNVGVGPQVFFGNDDTALAIRPMAGLEFKIPKAPLALGFDWRPMWFVSPDSDFEAGRFGLSFKYVM